MKVNLMSKLWKQKVQLPVLLTSRQNTEMLNAFNNNRRSKKDMNEIKDLVDTVLKNRSLTVFLAIVVVALFFGWIGG
jgi:hypothetical protein